MNRRKLAKSLFATGLALALACLIPFHIAPTSAQSDAGANPRILHFQTKARDAGGIVEQLSLASAHRRRKDFDAALEVYKHLLVNFNELNKGGRKISLHTVLNAAVSLGSDYPPAKDFIRGKRDSAEQVVTGTMSRDAIETAFTYNEALKEQARNVPIYLGIPPVNPLRQVFFTRVFTSLVQAGKYKEIAGIADVESIVYHNYPAFSTVCDDPTHHGHNHTQMERVQKMRIIEFSVAAVETCIAIGDPAKAKRIAGRALDYLGKDDRVFRFQIRHAVLRANPNDTDFLVWFSEYKASHFMQ